jgi:glycosyltransferase involved in cell wall biosynthesis
MSDAEIRISHSVRVCVVGQDLFEGGAILASLDLLDEFQRRDVEFDLFYIHRRGRFLDRLKIASPKTSVVFGNTTPRGKLVGSISSIVRLIKLARAAELIFAVNEGSATNLALLVGTILRKPVISWMHINWSEGSPFLPWWQRIPTSLLLRRCVYVVCCSQGVKNDLAENLRIPLEKLCYIPYPIDVEKIKERAAEPVDTSLDQEGIKFSLLTVGGLRPHKNQEMLIRSFKRVIDQGLSAQLIIIGEGPKRVELEKLIVELGLSDRVRMVGLKANPYPYFRAADLFVLSSLYEGNPLVLVEALIIGTPVISTDCPSGPREILLDGQLGALVPMNDVNALAKSIRAFFSEPSLGVPREKVEDVINPHRKAAVADQFLALFKTGIRLYHYGK